MTSAFHFAPPRHHAAAEELRTEIRAFLHDELADRPAIQRAESWNGFDAAFSRKLGQRGWIGMTWPKRLGGQERSALERYVVMEEMLAAGAPVAAHWIADRQSGPALLKFGSAAQQETILPRIAAGECFFCIGMSEPDSGSDLASVRTRATQVPDGWLVNGTKLWTTNAHHCHYMILFCRTAPLDREHRHTGTTQFLVDLTLPGIQIRPIPALTGEHHFNEVVFTDVLLPADAVLGAVGQGWDQVTGELANERSGPERFLSSFTVLKEMVGILGRDPDDRAVIALGRLAAHLATLRRLSRSIATMMQDGHDTSLQAAMVKDLGALLEQEIPEIARLFLDDLPPGEATRAFERVLAYVTLHAPSFSLRGGTREILRGMIARGLGVR